MINKYWDPKYSSLVEQVRAWNALEEGFYDDKNLRRYNDYKWMDLSETQMETQISKAQEDFKKYFYCPICRRKSLIKDAVVRRKMMDSSIKLDNALMPGWMKIKASAEYWFIRVCPDCAEKSISVEALCRAYDGNALETNTKKRQTAANSGCMGMLSTLIGMISFASWLVWIIL